jgi:alpha-mannosidase
LGLSRPGVQVTAFGPNPDGAGTILRLWELAGRSGLCAVRLPGRLPATQAQPVDLRGRPTGAAVPIRDGGFDLELKAFAPISLRLETAANLAE